MEKMSKADRVDTLQLGWKNCFRNTYSTRPLKSFYITCCRFIIGLSTDERVNKVTPGLFEKADNPFDMLKLSVEEIREIIKPCGLSPRKSKGIFELSRILVEEYNGIVPENMEKLEELPGVGHKTASVVMSQGLGIPHFLWILIFIELLKQELTNGKNVVQTEKDLKRLFPEKLWNKLHLQIIFFGREYCPARSCDGLNVKYVKLVFQAEKGKESTKKAKE